MFRWRRFRMIEKHESSLIDLAEEILIGKKEPVNLYDLFDQVRKLRGDEGEANNERLNAFYADITSSAKFVYMGDNTWDLKKHQKIDLWEKDGSHYNEYSEVEDEALDARLATQVEREKKHQAMLESRRQAEIEAEEAKLKAEEEALIMPEEDVYEEPEVNLDDIKLENNLDEVEELADDSKEDEVKDKKSDKSEKSDKEDGDEEYEDFDEEEYNEYMDEFEDKYDK